MTDSTEGRLLLFGGTGAIGSMIRSTFAGNGWSVVATGRTLPSLLSGKPDWVAFDPFAPDIDHSALDAKGPFSAVCWAQGANLNDSVYTVDSERHLELYKANALFVVETLRLLLDRKLLLPASRLCVVSSIWQDLARQNKLSYGMTKAALKGFVLSAAADLAQDGHMINAILPGALDTPMTRKNLDPAQIAVLEGATRFNRLPALEDVANLALFLCSRRNTGVTGQFINADLGFSHVRIL